MTDSETWKVSHLPLFDRLWVFGREFDKQYGGRRELIFRRHGEYVIEAWWVASNEDPNKQHAVGSDELAALDRLVERLKRETEG